MPKDNENIPFLGDDPLIATEPQGFTPDQMVRCEECLRANPPTRSNCLYCAASLPANERTSDFLRPSLKPVQSWTLGYNNIFLPDGTEIQPQNLREAADLLKLSSENLRRLVSDTRPLPLARTNTREESELIDRKLKAIGFATAVVSDAELKIRESPPIRLRSVRIDENGLIPKVIGETDQSTIPWHRLVLIVTGRLLRKRVELQERKAGRGQNEIEEVDQFFADEAIVDLYFEDPDFKFRIFANGFDFSGLDGKKLVVAENFSLLMGLLREKATNAEYDDAYNSCRQSLEIVWPCEHLTESGGWRREGPGKITVGVVTETSNEDQFTRYSRLRYLLGDRGKIHNET